jgi:hypothetical protein
MPNATPAINSIEIDDPMGKVAGSSGRPGGGGLAEKVIVWTSKAEAVNIFFI